MARFQGKHKIPYIGAIKTVSPGAAGNPGMASPNPGLAMPNQGDA